jgi:signal transduction histidine kinase
VADKLSTGHYSDLRVLSEILGPDDRLEFEHLLQWLRLSFLLTPALVLIAFGAPAVPYALSIAAVVALSFSWIGLLARYRPWLLLQMQLGLRIIDCGLVYLVLVNYHGFLHNAYYDTVYLLFVVAAAATHGRRGAWLTSGVAGMCVLAGRLQLISTGSLAFEVRHLTDAIFYFIFFAVTSSAVAFLMHRSAAVVARRDLIWQSEMSARNEQLQMTADELARSIHLRDMMIAGVTHDLLTPLTVIKLQAQMLRRVADQRLAANVERIERAATRMVRWIDELIEAATLQSVEDLHLALEPTDLVELARNIVQEHAEDSRRHQLHLDAHCDEIVGLFDAARLERVLDNLIGNAVKYSPSGGDIKIDVSADESWATIVVADNGVGIPEADLPHVFEPFRRGRNVVGHISGSGIGLANAERIVQRHGGQISVESAAGQGSTFTIRLPLG